MLRHAFLLVWQRKRANALLIVELVATFLVLFTLAGFALHFYRVYQQPLGFNVANTTSVSISTGAALIDADRATFRNVIGVVEQMDGVAAVELLRDPVFAVGGSGTRVTVGGQEIRLEVNAASAGFPEATGMKLLQGRWFGPEDEAQDSSTMSVLVNKVYADLAGEDVIGTLMPNADQPQRVVGIFEDFREHGEFVASRPFMLQRLRPEAEFRQLPLLVVVNQPGVGPAFEESLLAVLQRAAPGWDFDANSWSTLREAHVRLYVTPLLIAACVVAFLLLLVGFGLLGVLWQNVIRRTPEMGVRRAMGAPASAVRWQVVLELVAVALLALALGLLIVVQLPLAGAIAALDWSLFVPAALVSSAVLLALCILFALYPSYQATRHDPVDALRYE